MTKRKTLLFHLIITTFSFMTLAMLASCSEDEENSITLPELFAEGNTQIEVDVNDTIYLEFSNVFRGFDSTYYVTSNQSYYQARLISISLGDLAFDSSIVATDRMEIWSKELLPSSSMVDLVIEIQWLDESGVLIETTTKQYEISTTSVSFPTEVIIGTYPVNRQYYFLKSEYDKAFFFLERLPTDISKLSVSWLNTSGEVFHASGVTKNQEKNRLDFDLPTLENETIYAVELYDNSTLLKRIDFRTSKYDKFEQKIENLAHEQKANISYKFRTVYGLNQTASIIDEGFDLAEAGSGLASFIGQDSYVHPYCTGLVQLAFNPEGNDWFNLYIKSLIYAPFSNFEYEFTGPKELGDSLFLNMNFEFEDELSGLTDTEIQTGLANPISTTTFKIGNYISFSTWYEFGNLRYEVINSDLPPTPRMELISDHLLKPVSPDAYKYDMNYRLPDGTITSSRTYEMLYE
ncbi:hypothetical protein [Reichenbachiella sp.]|uniref:hypothetical protein n=2 Tax=Reichenbachiella sp. TaxID=2184521 RepID=UPI0032642B2A